MRKNRIVVAALSAAVGVLVGLGGTASAAAPESVRIEVDDFIPGDLDCGSYSLDQHVFGHIILRNFVKDDEVVMSLDNFALKHTWTNPDTGESLTHPDVGADHFTIKRDGSSILAIIGIVARVVVPGEGMVVGEIGRVELFFTDPDDLVPDVTLSGIHDGFDAVDMAICEALAPPS
jgi:hypothetical protein